MRSSRRRRRRFSPNPAADESVTHRWRVGAGPGLGPVSRWHRGRFANDIDILSGLPLVITGYALSVVYSTCPPSSILARTT